MGARGLVPHLNQLKEGDALLDALAHAYAGAARKVVAVPACAGVCELLAPHARAGLALMNMRAAPCPIYPKVQCTMQALLVIIMTAYRHIYSGLGCACD